MAMYVLARAVMYRGLSETQSVEFEAYYGVNDVGEFMVGSTVIGVENSSRFEMCDCLLNDISDSVDAGVPRFLVSGLFFPWFFRRGVMTPDPI